MKETTAECVYDHTGFITPDIDQSVQFWTEVMGFDSQPIGQRRQEWISIFTGVPGADIELVHLFGHGTHIEFIQFVKPIGEPIDAKANQPNIAHLCFRVNDVDAWRTKILAGGGSLQGEIVAITEGVAKGLRGLYMRDPHGVQIELVEHARSPLAR